jgi:hypothetical protein
MSQVTLRDSVIVWQHHRFALNDDHSMKTFTTDDADIQQLSFQGKVIENELIRLVILPEYGGRIISFFHKPSQHEYLYQSECGSPYGIGDGNFYYNWLMVYGGIFPTFPEPEHGKTWLLPWDFSILINSADQVTIRMEYTDDQSYPDRPGSFNNGTTNITCQIDVSVYKNSSLWDYDVNLINNKSTAVNYEYWTCTTLTPGSLPGETAAPLNSEIILPVDDYFAGWSPNAWIGSYNSVHDFENVNFLSEWNDMGIGYAHELDKRYWGVINHENEEGIFRISDNVETPGMKLWTWGKNNVDNNMLDFSNGGADNYIELWGGTSRSFFEDAVLSANQTKSWTESYCATVGMTSISEINEHAAANLIWDEDENLLTYQVNTFAADRDYKLQLYIDGVDVIEIAEEAISFQPLGINQSISLANLDIAFGDHIVSLDLIDDTNESVLLTSKNISVSKVLGLAKSTTDLDNLQIENLGHNSLRLKLLKPDRYMVQVISANGHVLQEDEFIGRSTDLSVPKQGLYFITVSNNASNYTQKVVVH